MFDKRNSESLAGLSTRKFLRKSMGGYFLVQYCEEQGAYPVNSCQFGDFSIHASK